jgi:hypothetical protein
MRTSAKQRAEVVGCLCALGFTVYEAEQLRRIAMTLHRWAELECGTDDGHIERDETTGKPRFHSARCRYVHPHDPRATWTIPDREAGALKRLGALMAQHPWLAPYHQGDPRGASLYIVRKADIGDADIASVYNRGVAVY